MSRTIGAPAAPSRRRLYQLGGALLLAGVLVATLVVVSQRSGEPASPGTSDAAGLVGTVETRELFEGIPQKSTTLGDPDAPVKVTEFVDAQCPFCRDYALNQMPALVSEQVRAGKVSMELAPLTFLGDDSVRAARATAAAAESGRAWQFSDLLYRNQGAEGSGWVTDELLGKAATAAGLDPTVVRAAAVDPAYETQVESWAAQATEAGVASTPSFLVEGGGKSETVDAAGLEAAIERAGGR